MSLTYDELLIESDSNNLIAKEKNLPVSKGRIKGNRIAIRKNIPTVEKACVLAEELGHHYTTVGNILYQDSTEKRKQEMRARIIAYNKMIGISGLLNSYQAGCTNRYEIADYLNITEEFLCDALTYYKSKYGTCTVLDNYMIYFEPLGVLELYK